MTILSTLQTLSTTLRAYSFNFRDELELHDLLEQAMAADGWVVEREVKLSEKDRIDFVVHRKDAGGVVGVEVKVKASVANVERQLRRYAAHERIEGLLVVSCTIQLKRLPEEIGGKPVRVTILSDTI